MARKKKKAPKKAARKAAPKGRTSVKAPSRRGMGYGKRAGARGATRKKRRG